MAKPRQPLLRKADFSSYLETRAREMAPRDVEMLLAQSGDARARAAKLSPRLGEQMALAIDLLADHHSGEAAQIPFYTIGLLAEAVYYFLDPNDVIPDWIPEIGKLDDALVLELAFELGADGIRRYCAWKDIDEAPFYGPAKAAAPPPRAAAAKPAAGGSRASQRGASSRKKPAEKRAAAKPRKAPGKSGAKKRRSR